MVRPSTLRFVCALFAIVAVAAADDTTIAPTNSSVGDTNYPGTIELQDNQGKNITTLLPLTSAAEDQDVSCMLDH